MRAQIVTAVLLAGVGMAGTAAGDDPVTIIEIASPAPESSQTGNLTASSSGLYLSWLEEVPEGHALRFAAWDGEVFGEARTIHTSGAFFANWADFASMLELADGSLVAHWLEKAAAGTYEYDVWVAMSADGGVTWSEPERPHRDGTLSEHGFVSLVREGQSGFAGVWLDGRNFRDGAVDNEMSLMFTTVEHGRFQAETLLDGRVCECCQTGMVQTARGPIVVYRDRSPEEVRDIAIVRRVGGEWTEPVTLHEDGWEIPGCPVNGPQVAAAGDRAAVAWFTGADDEPRVQLVRSEDGGAHFGEPVRLDDGQPVGRVDVEYLGDDLIVSWVERGDEGSGAVRLRRVGSTVAPSVGVAQTGSRRASGFPRIAVFEGEVFVSWTEAYARRGPTRVRVARVAFE